MDRCDVIQSRVGSVGIYMSRQVRLVRIAERDRVDDMVMSKRLAGSTAILARHRIWARACFIFFVPAQRMPTLTLNEMDRLAVCPLPVVFRNVW